MTNIIKGSTLYKFLSYKMVHINQDTKEDVRIVGTKDYSLRRRTNGGFTLSFNGSRYTYKISFVRLANNLVYFTYRGGGTGPEYKRYYGGVL